MNVAKLLPIVKRDKWLEPFASIIEGRHNDLLRRLDEFTIGGKRKLSDFANAYNYYGLHRTESGWIFREWAPGATAIYLIGTFNDWTISPQYSLISVGNGNWEISLPANAIKHLDLYKIRVEWSGGWGDRIPAYATMVVQDPDTYIFSAKVWEPEEQYVFKKPKIRPRKSPLLIYECHVGMAQQKEAVGTYEEFRTNVLPRVAEAGYNAIQLMAIQEHPYYGSFGYHVSSFYAPSSRFGTPHDLMRLIDDAHSRGIAVILDIVHSHAVKNEVEGLGRFDGSPSLYFHSGARREHPAWDSLCFDYGKPQVINFLLSNCKYWMEKFHFDGFRFDGVTSMIYYNHGLGQNFTSYNDYYNGNQDTDALVYLSLANILIHELNPHAITIAEEMSGLPGLASKVKDGGIGFDYRMAMGIPDYWIKVIKELKDEDWKPGAIFWELTNRRADEKTISYAESHDQALVGDKTIIFRLIDSDMYWHMMVNDNALLVERGIALHKIIRLVTASTINGGYLNFMGNEFGHPEWIDFPSQANNWSYKYARRQWDLVDRTDLKYKYLAEFDNQMIHLLSSIKNFEALPIVKLCDNNDDQILAYNRGDYLFIFNFNPVKSFVDYGILAPEGKYDIVLDSDDSIFGGRGNIDHNVEYFTQYDRIFASDGKGWLNVYMPARSALVLRKQP